MSVTSARWAADSTLRDTSVPTIDRTPSSVASALGFPPWIREIVLPADMHERLTIHTAQPTSRYGRRRPRRLVQWSESTPTIGCTRSPLSGPAISTRAVTLELKPSRCRKREARAFCTAHAKCVPRWPIMSTRCRSAGGPRIRGTSSSTPCKSSSSDTSSCTSSANAIPPRGFPPRSSSSSWLKAPTRGPLHSSTCHVAPCARTPHDAFPIRPSPATRPWRRCVQRNGALDWRC